MKLGIGLPTSGYDDNAKAIVSALGAEVVVLLNAEDASNAHELADKTVIVRLDTPRVHEGYAAYVDRIESRVRPFYELGLPVIYFQLGNEPEVGAVDVPTPWGIQDWINSSYGYVTEFRQRFPGAAVISTPFKTENTGQNTRSYLDRYDAISVHCYWQIESDVFNPMFGASWQHVVDMYGGNVPKPIFATEVNNSAGTDVGQIREWIASADGILAGMALFIAGGTGMWAVMNVTVDQARAIAAPARPEPVRYYDLHFRDMSIQDYEDAVRGGSFTGRTSPLLGEANYWALRNESERANGDPRLALAFMWAEGHMATDPGLVAARVNNLGGIKWAGQDGAYDSGIPADTGGTYAGYPDIGGYVRGFWETLNDQYLKPFFTSGDLLLLVETYTNGPGTGHVKIDFYNHLRAKYPESHTIPPIKPLPSPDPSNPAPLPPDYPNGVAASIPELGRRVAEEAMAHVGETLMGPGQPIDDQNGYVHPMAEWCEAGAESVAAKAIAAALGISLAEVRVRFPSAYAHFRSLRDDGAIDPDPNTADAGDFDFYGPYSNFLGHITIRGTDGLSYGTSVVPNMWVGRPVSYYPSYLGHAEPEAVMRAAKAVNKPADPMNEYGVVDESGEFRAFYTLRAQYANDHVPVIGHAILHKWQENGPQLGILRYGYPLSLRKADGTYVDETAEPVFDVGTGEHVRDAVVQWFERSRLEFHPENEEPYRVLAGRIGAEFLVYWREQGHDIAAVDPSTDNVDPQFVEYWNGHGALNEFGYPLSGLVTLPGTKFPSQVFERAVLEFHAENDAWPVQLRRLGAEWIALRQSAQPEPRILA